MRNGVDRIAARHCVTSSLRRACSARGGRLIAAACLALFMGGCTNIGYYAQSVQGQIDVWSRQREISEVMRDSRASEEIRRKLALVVQAREFAVRELGLPENGSYQRYADIGRPYVVWNVFATPEFSMKPVHWCMAFVGCVNYRGYFAKEDAERLAAELRQQGHDVYVGGVPAYSTLGWFSDPVLNTMMRYSDQKLARVVFHELAHQVVYAKGDTVFNESFAVAVETEGAKRWLARHGSAQDKKAYDNSVLRRQGFTRLIETHRAWLKALYKSRLAPDAMRAEKKRILEEMGREYLALKASWNGYPGYDRWFAQGLNNAHLASVSIYARMVPAFQALLRREGGDLRRFYAAVNELARRPREERTAGLKALMPSATASAR
ncbi:MAG: aminopeptidase [Betaproteobacteria bacterium]|nr:aminopeptidase [Betaproteobacteria bacterium]